jgi:hypothetical protein
MKQRSTVRVALPFSVDALIETYPDNTGKVLGYNIRGPGSDPHWLYSEDELAVKLDELQARVRGEKQPG